MTVTILPSNTRIAISKALAEFLDSPGGGPLEQVDAPRIRLAEATRRLDELTLGLAKAYLIFNEEA